MLGIILLLLKRLYNKKVALKLYYTPKYRRQLLQLAREYGKRLQSANDEEVYRVLHTEFRQELLQLAERINDDKPTFMRDVTLSKQLFDHLLDDQTLTTRVVKALQRPDRHAEHAFTVEANLNTLRGIPSN